MGAQSLYKVMSQSVAIFDIPPFWTQWTDSNFQWGERAQRSLCLCRPNAFWKESVNPNQTNKILAQFSPISIEAFYKVDWILYLLVHLPGITWAWKANDAELKGRNYYKLWFREKEIDSSAKELYHSLQTVWMSYPCHDVRMKGKTWLKRWALVSCFCVFWASSFPSVMDVFFFFGMCGVDTSHKTMGVSTTENTVKYVFWSHFLIMSPSELES